MTDPVLVKQVAEELADLPEAEQLDLLAPPETAAGEAKLPELVKRGRGRPPLARNKRQERELVWLKQRYTDPRERLAAIVSMNTADLAGLLNCTMSEAAQEQRLCAAILLPYWAQKQPIAINLETNQPVHLHVDLGDFKHAAGGIIDLAPRVLDNEEFQEVSGKGTDDV